MGAAGAGLSLGVLSQKLRFRRRRLQRGFSLLELLVTVTILTILVTLAIPGYGRAVERAKVRDAQAVLVSIYNAQRMYRLDQTTGTPPTPTYGTLPNLVNNRYLTDPDPGGSRIPGDATPGGSNTDWNFAVVSPSATTFTATATRTGGSFNGSTIILDQTYTGAPLYGLPPLRVYAGTHTLRD